MRTRQFALAPMLVVALLLASCTPGSPSNTSTSPGTSNTATAAPPAANPTSPYITPAAEVQKVVVNVGIEQRGNGSNATQTVGNGSGIIIRSDGYILTNDHVVSAGDAVTAVIESQTIPARVVGRDAKTDLAVIKVARTGLPAARLGVPSALKIGDLVIAVGYPFGVGKTVTQGIVSALGQSALAPLDQNPVQGSGPGSVAAYTELIQTDASINPGNSGGALATLDGRIVGVNTLIESPSGTSAGIGFAIPIDFAMDVAKQLIKNGKAIHPFLGIGIVTVTPQVAQQLGLKVTQGVLVQVVRPNSAAEKAGLHKNDIIVELAGMPITDVEDLYAALRSQQIGATVPIVVVRNGKRQTLNVTIGSDKTP